MFLYQNHFSMILIGYSGHAYVVSEILFAMGLKVDAYCDRAEKENNPLQITYLGNEFIPKALEAMQKNKFFIAIGNNHIRRNIFDKLGLQSLFPINAIHPLAVVSTKMQMGTSGIMISSGVCINPFSIIGNGVICNTGCIIEHECQIGDFAHIGPGAVLCGNVHIGENSFVGAQSVVREGIKIGKNVIIGAGSVVVKDIPDNFKVAGNPTRPLA